MSRHAERCEAILSGPLSDSLSDSLWLTLWLPLGHSLALFGSPNLLTKSLLDSLEVQASVAYDILYIYLVAPNEIRPTQLYISWRSGVFRWVRVGCEGDSCSLLGNWGSPLQGISGGLVLVMWYTSIKQTTACKIPWIRVPDRHFAICSLFCQRKMILVPNVKTLSFGCFSIIAWIIGAIEETAYNVCQIIIIDARTELLTCICRVQTPNPSPSISRRDRKTSSSVYSLQYNSVLIL